MNTPNIAKKLRFGFVVIVCVCRTCVFAPYTEERNYYLRHSPSLGPYIPNFLSSVIAIPVHILQHINCKVFFFFENH